MIRQITNLYRVYREPVNDQLPVGSLQELN